MQQLTPQMAKITRGLAGVMKNMNTVKLGVTMDKFETLIGDMDVTTATMESSFETVNASTTPSDQVRRCRAQRSISITSTSHLYLPFACLLQSRQVDELMQQVADQHDLELFEDSSAPTRAPKLPEAQKTAAPVQSEEDALAARLAALQAS